MATEEDLFAAIQGYEPAPIDSARQQAIAAQQEIVRQAKADVAAKEAAVPQFWPSVGAALSGIGQGLSLNLSDEALAGLSSLFGGSSYSEELQRQAEERQRMQTQYPVASVGGEIAGAIGGAIPTTAIAAPGLASRLLLGATGKAAPTLGQLAAIGATQGAVASAGAAQPGERLVQGLMGGAIGSVAAPTVGKIAQLGAQTVGEKIGLLRALIQGTQPELGAINLGGLPKLSKAEIQLAKTLSETSPEGIKSAEQALIQAGEFGKPLFLPEAVQSPALYQQAKLIANYPESINVAQTAIESRAANAIDRMTQTLDIIHPDRNVTSGANKLVEGAQALLNEMGVARKQATAPLYDAAFSKTPELTDTASIDLIAKNPRIQQAIRQVRKEVPELADLPDASLEVLHQAQQYLSGKARSLTNKYTANKVKDARTALMDAIKAESPDYAAATDTFAKMSKGLTEKEQSKIGFLATVSPNKPETIGRVFALDADVIQSLRKDFENAGFKNEWEAGVRSYLQRALNKARDEKNPIEKLIGSPELRDKLNAALGNKADRVIEPLTIEQQILKGQRKYFAGSPSTPLLQQEKALEESKGAISAAARLLSNPKTEIGKFLTTALGGTQNKQFYEDYAKLLFTNPRQGIDTLSRLQELAGGFRSARNIGGQVGAVAGVTAGRETEPTLESISKLGKPPATQSMLSQISQPQTNQIDDIFQQIQNFQPETKAQVLSNVKIGKTNISIPTGDQYAPPDLVQKVIQIESAGNPNAVSSKGAQGLMQLMPATAKALGVDPTDPIANVEGGSRYLKQLIDKYGSHDIALAAYNWGPGNIDKAISKLKARNKAVSWNNIRKFANVPMETRLYVNKVLKA